MGALLPCLFGAREASGADCAQSQGRARVRGVVAGTYTWAGGSTYTGEWLADKKHGSGKNVQQPSGQVYEGEWSKGASEHICAARTLNATGQRRVTLSRWSGHLRAACGPRSLLEDVLWYYELVNPDAMRAALDSVLLSSAAIQCCSHC